MKYSLLFIIIVLFCISCNKSESPNPDDGPFLIVKLKFDPDQERLGNIGQPATIPAGHSAQTPQFRDMSIHFLELVPTEFTPYKAGEEVYSGKEISTSTSNPHNFTTAIDFENAVVAAQGEEIHRIPLKDIAPGTYKHLRASVTFQRYDILFDLINIPGFPDLPNQSGTVASFLGYFMHLGEISVRDQSTLVNQDVLQGFWAFETDLDAPYDAYNQLSTGQAPEGATTVVNPFPTAIPPGSCVVSGTLAQPFVVTGNESENLDLILSFSINQSLEWMDDNGNGKLDVDAGNGTAEQIVDMGLRGLIGNIE